MAVLKDKELITDFLTRGVENVYPTPEEVEKKLKKGERLKIYTGVDPTGESLHLGHAVVFRKLAKLQKMGHEIIVLIGNFTAKIGDPTDKMAARTALTDDDIKKNMKSYVEQLSPIIDFNDKENPVEVVYNADWLAKMTFEDLVRLASNFTVQQMIERDMFQKRLEEGKPIHVHEFLYPLMQGYDSVALNVDMEIGGNDQTFNMLAGRTLEGKLLNKEKFVMTMQMLTDSKGKKMSKTDNNFVGLTDSAEDMYGKIMSWADEMIVNGMKILTDMSADEIEKISKAIKNGENPRDFKLQLAYEIVRIYKGEPEANVARDHFIKVFSKGEKPVDIDTMRSSSQNILDAIVEVGLVNSKSEARRVIEQGGVKVDDEVIGSFDFKLSKGLHLVQKGKRHFINIEIN